jgi:hypothetical protein
MNCQSCGKPKDESEEYEMPSDTASAATVEDPNLLRMAEAGEHWKCQYCGSHQRDLDGGCARCGAGRKEGANQRGAPVRTALPHVARARIWNTTRFRVLAVAFVVMLCGMCVVLKNTKPRTVEMPARDIQRATATPPRTDFPATVTRATWSRSVVVEQWQLAPHEGFTADLPANALNVKAAGQHFHHNEDVFDHDETVYDEVEVPDGYTTESYTERVACGEDCTGSGRTCSQQCTPRPQNCREVCTDKKNGFASCKQVCSGGGQDCREVCTGTERRCTTRYCNQSRTRQVPKTKKEKRPRTVKKYRQEPRNAPWSTFSTWEWVKVREAEDSGDATPTWPDAGAPKDAGAPLEDGGIRAGAEREVRKASYRVFLKYEDGQEREYDPKTEEELAGLPVGMTVQTRVYGLEVTLLRD